MTVQQVEYLIHMQMAQVQFLASYMVIPLVIILNEDRKLYTIYKKRKKQFLNLPCLTMRTTIFSVLQFDVYEGLKQ